MTVGEDKAASGQLPPLFDSSLKGSEMCSSECRWRLFSKTLEKFLRRAIRFGLEPCDDPRPDGLEWIWTRSPIARGFWILAMRRPRLSWRNTRVAGASWAGDR